MRVLFLTALLGLIPVPEVHESGLKEWLSDGPALLAGNVTAVRLTDKAPGESRSIPGMYVWCGRADDRIEECLAHHLPREVFARLRPHRGEPETGMFMGLAYYKSRAAALADLNRAAYEAALERRAGRWPRRMQEPEPPDDPDMPPPCG